MTHVRKIVLGIPEDVGDLRKLVGRMRTQAPGGVDDAPKNDASHFVYSVKVQRMELSAVEPLSVYTKEGDRASSFLGSGFFIRSG